MPAAFAGTSAPSAGAIGTTGGSPGIARAGAPGRRAGRRATSDRGETVAVWAVADRSRSGLSVERVIRPVRQGATATGSSTPCPRRSGGVITLTGTPSSSTRRGRFPQPHRTALRQRRDDHVVEAPVLERSFDGLERILASCQPSTCAWRRPSGPRAAVRIAFRPLPASSRRACLTCRGRAA